MLNLEINLIPRKEARDLKLERVLKKLKGVSFWTLGVYVLVLLLVFIGRFALKQIKDGLVRQEAAAIKQIESYAVVESQHLVVKTKLQVAGGVLGSQKKWSLLVDDIVNFVSEEALLADMSLRTEGVMVVTVRTSELQNLARMLNSLANLGENRDFVTEVLLESVTKDKSGAYDFKITFET